MLATGLVSVAPATASGAEPGEQEAAAVETTSEVKTPAEGLDFFDTGPLRIREQFLLSQGFLAFEPTSADVLAKGEWQVDLIQNATNNWAQSDIVQETLEARDRRAPLTLEGLRSLETGTGEGLFYADGELHRSSLSVRAGIGHGYQLFVTVPLLRFRGGFGDSTIEGFHDTFGFSQSGRLGVPRDAFTVYLRDRDGHETFRDRAPSSGIGDISLGLKKRLRSGRPEWRLAVEGQLKLSTGDEEDLYGSGSEDLGAQVLATRYYQKSCVHLGVSAIYLGESEVFATDDQLLLSVMAGYERALGHKTSVVVQGTVSQSPFRDLDVERLDDIAYLVDLGIKHGFHERWVLFVALSENLLNFGSTADVGAHFGITWTQ